MDFFQHQEVARKKTSLLIVYFAIALTLIVMAVYAAVAGIWLYLERSQHISGDQMLDPNAIWHPELFAVVAAATVIVIVAGSLYKIGTLRGGGAVVAQMLGGELISPNTRDLDQRVVLNVVEEMAIASGVPVPPVYLLAEEHAINAFAAGFTPNDAVIGVTRGTVELLSRDELQAVIAHEFSHILNGDMRLNIRLMGLLHGILLIALIGYGLLRSLRYTGRSRNKKGGGGLMLAILAIGLALLVIGYIGVFFGRLIKSAVSRQREFLADASAVQFTRNPDGITGCLKKIGGYHIQSRIEKETAEEAAHLFFSNALSASMVKWLSTHPPLDVRIRRIDPQFDGKFPAFKSAVKTARDIQRGATRSRREKQQAAIRARAPGSQTEMQEFLHAFQPEAAVASIGTIDEEHVDYAAALVTSIPDPLRSAAHEPFGAVATVFCLLLDRDPATRQKQLDVLQQFGERGVHDETRRLLPQIQQLGREARLPLVEMAIPALAQLSPQQHDKFANTVKRLVEADQNIVLFEYALQRMLLRHLAPRFYKQRPTSVKYTSLRPLRGPIACLLSTLAHAGNQDAASAQRAFARGLRRVVSDEGVVEMMRREDCSLVRLNDALNYLAEASPAVKRRVLQACAECIHCDGKVTVDEAELLRIVADSLDCPMPPLMATAG